MTIAHGALSVACVYALRSRNGVPSPQPRVIHLAMHNQCASPHPLHCISPAVLYLTPLYHPLSVSPTVFYALTLRYSHDYACTAHFQLLVYTRSGCGMARLCRSPAWTTSTHRFVTHVLRSARGVTNELVKRLAGKKHRIDLMTLRTPTGNTRAQVCEGGD